MKHTFNGHFEHSLSSDPKQADAGSERMFPVQSWLTACVMLCLFCCGALSAFGAETTAREANDKSNHAAELRIPDEYGFDIFEEFSIEDLANIKLYDRYPSGWNVLDLMPLWRAMPDDKIDPKWEIDEAEIRNQAAQILAKGEPIKVTMDRKGRSIQGAKRLSVATFTVPSQADLDQHSYLLHFEREGFGAVYVNGKKAFGRTVGYASFTGDISDYVNPGNNTICMVNAGWCMTYESQLLVAPRSYVKNMYLTCNFLGSELVMDCSVVNRDAVGKRKLTAKVTTYGDKSRHVDYSDTIERDLQKGENKFVWKIRMMDPVYWDLDNPHLYEIRIYDENGKVLGKDRFGFRDFRAKNGRFYLNGHLIKLFGSSSYGKVARLPDIPMKPGEYKDTLDKRFNYAFMRMWKKANCNTVHSYTGKNDRRGLYEACDELGMLAFSMFPGWGATWSKDYGDREEALENSARASCDLLLYRYNHPSFVMLTMGSELYTVKPENLAYVYHQLKSVDKQKRLITSSGRFGVASNRGEEDTVDFADDHSYWGTMNDAWFRNGPHFRKEKGKVRDMYGAKPLLTSETFEPYLMYYIRGWVAEWNQLMNAETLDRQAYVDLAQNKESGGLTNLILSRGMGIKRWATDEIYANRVIAELFQRIVEQIRQDGTLDGFLPFHITDFCPYVIGKSPLASVIELNNTGPRYKGLKAARLADVTEEGFMKKPQYYMMKRVYNPQLISARWFDRNLISGKGEIKTAIYAINDTAKSHSYTGTVLFKSPSGKVLNRKDLDFGLLASATQKVDEYDFKLPSGLETGDYYLELYLFENGKRINDNYYRVFVFSAKDVEYVPNTKKAVAYYGGGLSLEMLKNMGLKFDRLENFKSLDKYQVLIIGADSIDETLYANGNRITKWVEKGGRMLSLAQSKTGYMPWLPEIKVVAAAPVAAIDMVEEKHPVYANLRQEYFDTWNGDGYLFTHALDPLNKAVVAAGGTAYTLNKLAYTRPIVSDIAVGKGVMLLNQLKVSGRYDNDAVATIVANNLVRYILSDDSTFSEKIERSEKEVVNLDIDACHYVDLKPYATAALRDNAVASDGKGGWDDYSDGNDCEIDVGEQRLNGVPYYIIPPEENEGRSCIMLDNPRLPWSVKGVKGIAIGRKFHDLHILHTGLSSVQDYTLVFIYEDGTQERHEIKKKVHIGSWIKPPKGGWPQADYGWTGSTPMQPQVVLWHTDWHNPHPAKVVKSIDIEGPDDSGACIVGMTLYEVLGEEGWENKRLMKEKKIEMKF